MKIVLGLIVLVGLAVGAWALFPKGETGSEAVSLTETEMPDPPEVTQNEVDAADTSDKMVLEISTEGAEGKTGTYNPEVEAQAELSIEILDGNGVAPAGSGSNKVQKALENILGGSTVLGGPTPGEMAREDLTANLEHDAIKTETWVDLEEALTVDGFDSLAISQAVIGPRVDDATKAAIMSLLTLGEERPEQIQYVVSEIRKILGLSTSGE